MSIKDYRGAMVTGANAKSLELYETAIKLLNCYTGDPMGVVDAALAESPGMAMGYVLKAHLVLSGMERASIPVAIEAANKLRELPLNDRERRHATAVNSLIEGAFLRTTEQLEDIAVEDPHDILAVQMGHLLDFYRGDSRNLRDRVARVLPDWSADMPGYHCLLGMHSFGLEEMGDYARAEVVGRKAVELEHRDSWAHHAVAHVMEMQGRDQDGAAWLTGGQTGWTESFFAVHNWWHVALFLLETDQVDKALEIYDGLMRGGQSPVVFDMLDHSALLWRLYCRGVDVGNRWQALADRWQPLIEDKLYAFNDVHALIPLLGAGRDAEVERLISVMTVTAGQQTDNGAMTRDVGLPLARALVAFHRGQYATVLELLRPVRNIAARFGGSHAQRDLIDLTLLAAASRSGNRGQLRALANERLELRPRSPLALRYRQQAQG
ncbi:MAG TPA: tetratricopeptide repeat protein [Haliangium sp.]|nr:tetratricopeptide repeat protein [Haliangium sp.]